ncbi:MAG: glycosyltransferase family 2 protein [Ignavibacteriaceae bacterium]|nr:glycosyltransferase family 2 protein [Ignavibacteriaceae bacterium]
MNTAPVVIFVYNRPTHFLQIVEALAANNLAPETDLIVISDGAKKPADEDKVREIRAAALNIKGFRSVDLIAREKNYGLAASIIDGVTRIVNEYGRIIVLEDDHITSPWFLRYMNDALELYETEERVISIHGYIYPVKEKLPETFFMRGADCWGWATWKRGWDLFEKDGEKLLNRLQSENLTHEFDYLGAANNVRMLKRQIAGKNNSWAIRWHASAFLNNKLTLYPGTTLITNIGADGSGENTKETDQLYSPVTQERINVGGIPVEASASAFNAVKNFFLNFGENKGVVAFRKLKYLVKNLFR